MFLGIATKIADRLDSVDVDIVSVFDLAKVENQRLNTVFQIDDGQKNNHRTEKEIERVK